MGENRRSKMTQPKNAKCRSDSHDKPSCYVNRHGAKVKRQGKMRSLRRAQEFALSAGAALARPRAAMLLRRLTTGWAPRPPNTLDWRGGRVVECTALEMRHTGNRIGGSNPSLSAIIFLLCD